MWILLIVIVILVLAICLNSIFSFKKFNLVIWRNKGNIQTVRYIFDGWTNEEIKKKYFGSISFLESEASAGRTIPSLGRGGICRLLTDLPEIENAGTQVGSVVEIDYITTAGSPEMFEHFFKELGIAFHRSDPFFKPIKTLWQALNKKTGS